jgi:diguanylate cyclase (GGDEF)-like protein
MEGLDIRTLTLINLLLGLFLGIGSMVFARIHPSFRSFKTLGYSYLLLSFGFTLIGLRQYIFDFLSIVMANFLVSAGFSLLILGIIKFLKFDMNAFKRVSVYLLLLIASSFFYFTYIDANINARIIVISTFIAGLSIFAGYKVLMNKDRIIFTFTRLLGLSFIYCAFIFSLRIYLTLFEPELNDFMNAGTIHALSLIAFQLVVITSSFALTISACQQLANKLATQATIDSLTHVYNRRAFDEFASKSVLRAQREKRPISLIIMVIDLFNQVNDDYGHQIGDRVLKEFSQRLKNSLRQYDILARYGGEEFTLLLPDTNNATAMLIAKKLRDKIAQPVFFLGGEAELNITASFGVATSQGDNIDWQQIISFADQALYQAKENGRNCVMCHSAEIYHLSEIELGK